MAMMGLIVLLVPMGFQFLAALSGKAFLMAKLALLLASVNGLKRVSRYDEEFDGQLLMQPDVYR